jgi:TyrR family helix-turn-helix protein
MVLCTPCEFLNNANLAMKLRLSAENRLGITAELLRVLADMGYDVAAMEVATNVIHIDIPTLKPERLAQVEMALRRVGGFRRLSPVDLLPAERERLALRAVLDSIAEPVLFFDRDRRLSQWNDAAAALLPAEVETNSPPDMLGALGRENAKRLTDSGEARPVELIFGVDPYLAEPRVLDSDGRRSGLLLTLRKAERTGRLVAALDSRTADGFNAILGDSPAMRTAKERARRLAVVDAPLLLRGDTGTGKELFARACHAESPRAGAAFLALNCAAVPENLAESEIFGYAPGAFSGAARDGKPGLVELAEGGTLFLDEVGELSAYLQAKLLRFLQDGSYRRIGGRRERTADVRIVAATNRDLEADIRDGRFRDDLFYRLAVLTLTLPALEDRREDIAALAQAFVSRAAAQIGRDPPELTAEARALLCARDWPGNVRQLESTLFRAVSLCDGDAIGAADLAAEKGAPPTAAPAEAESHADAMARFEEQLLRGLYPHYPSSRKLAKRLGLAHTTVAEKLRRHGIP